MSLACTFVASCEPREDEYANADWKPLSAPLRDLTDIFFVTGDIGFVAGNVLLDSMHTSVLEDRGDILTWIRWVNEPHIITDPTPYYQKTVRTVPETPPPNFFKTRDGGASWSAIATPFVTSVTDIYFVNPSYGFVTTSREGVYKTTDGGEQWQKVLEPIIFLGSQTQMTNPYNRIYFVNEELGFAFADLTSNNGDFGSYRPVVIRTDDGGKRWTFVSGPYELPELRITNTVFTNNPLIGYANGNNEGYVTLDGGASWQGMRIEVPEDMIESPEVNKPGETFYDINGVTLWDDHSGYIVANRGNQIFTVNNGQTSPLTSLQTNPANYPRLFSSRIGIYSPKEDVFYLIGSDETGAQSRGQVFVTKDGGQSFTETTGIGERAIYDWSFVGSTGYLVGQNGMLLKYEGN